MRALDIAAFLNAPLIGKDFEISKPSSMNSFDENSFIFLSKYNENIFSKASTLKNLLCLTTTDLATHLNCSTIALDDPKLAFAHILSEFFINKPSAGVSETAIIEPGAQISRTATIGSHTYISSQSIIGDNTYIGHNVSIVGKVNIGQNCFIKSNTTIGEPGFGILRNRDNIPVPFPHIGEVVLGNNVEIGSNCTIARATLDQTILDDYVKTDDHVHVAHNCIIGKGTFIAAGAILAGSTTVGENVWISPNVTIIDQNKIGDNAFIGLGSVVTKPVSSNVRVFGSPAHPIGRKRKTKL